MFPARRLDDGPRRSPWSALSFLSGRESSRGPPRSRWAGAPFASPADWGRRAPRRSPRSIIQASGWKHSLMARQLTAPTAATATSAYGRVPTARGKPFSARRRLAPGDRQLLRCRRRGREPQRARPGDLDIHDVRGPLHPPLGVEEGRAEQHPAISLEDLRRYHQVGDTGLVLQREERHPLGGGWPLAADDQSGDADTRLRRRLLEPGGGEHSLSV